MRGDNSQSPNSDSTRQLMDEVARQAITDSPRRQRLGNAASAVLVDEHGNTLFRILATWWSKTVVLAFGMALLMIILLGVISFNNKIENQRNKDEIDQLKRELGPIKDKVDDNQNGGH